MEHYLNKELVVDCSEPPYTATFNLEMCWVLGVGRARILHLEKDGKEELIYFPYPFFSRVDNGDPSDWPTWIWLALRKIIANNNRKGNRSGDMAAVFINSLRQVILEETGKDIKEEKKRYVKRLN